MQLNFGLDYMYHYQRLIIIEENDLMLRRSHVLINYHHTSGAILSYFSSIFFIKILGTSSSQDPQNVIFIKIVEMLCSSRSFKMLLFFVILHQASSRLLASTLPCIRPTVNNQSNVWFQWVKPHITILFEWYLA